MQQLLILAHNDRILIFDGDDVVLAFDLLFVREGTFPDGYQNFGLLHNLKFNNLYENVC